MKILVDKQEWDSLQNYREIYTLMEKGYSLANKEETEIIGLYLKQKELLKREGINDEWIRHNIVRNLVALDEYEPCQTEKEFVKKHGITTEPLDGTKTKVSVYSKILIWK